jgi:hypothetical protein
VQAHAQALEPALQNLMRRVGRQCRGRGHVLVTLVRQTETPWLARGEPVLPLARAAQQRLPGVTTRSEAQRACLDPQITTAIEAPHRMAHPSRRRTPGKALTPGTMVHADDPTLAPMGTGPSHGPAPCGRKPGMIAEPAAGFICGRHMPVGTPRDASDVQPLIDHVQPAIGRGSTDPSPTLHALAGAWACTAASLREALPQQGILPVGIPHTVEPLPPSPTPADVRRLLGDGGVPGVRTSCQVHLADACGDSRPVVARLMASLLGRGAARSPDQGQHGALVHRGMTVRAHNAATWVRIHESRLSKRARTFRRRLRLRCRQVSQCNASIN